MRFGLRILGLKQTRVKVRTKLRFRVLSCHGSLSVTD